MLLYFVAKQNSDFSHSYGDKPVLASAVSHLARSQTRELDLRKKQQRILLKVVEPKSVYLSKAVGTNIGKKNINNRFLRRIELIGHGT